MATSSSEEATPRLSEEAIPTHRSISDPSKNQNMEKNGPVDAVANVDNLTCPPRAKTCSSIPTRSPSPQRKTPSLSQNKPKGKETIVTSQKGRPSSKTSVRSQSMSQLSQGKHGGGNKSAVNGKSDTIDLTDPDKLLQQLSNVDLTDEDTDVLLEEAYALNKKLRAELQRQEEEAKRNRGHRLPPLDSQTQAKLQEKTKLYGASMPGASRPSQSRSKTSQSAAVSHSRPQAQGVMGERRQQQGSTSGKKRLAKSPSPVRNKEKPGWDDRFSFT